MAISFFISVRLLGEADPEIVNIFELVPVKYKAPPFDDTVF